MQSSISLDLSRTNPKQALFFKAKNKFVAYGGARGGGKSWAVRMKAILLALNYSGIKLLFLRRTYKDLERNHVRELKPILQGLAKYSEQKKCFYFPNGSLLEMGYCDSESDVDQYQGIEYDVIFMDEATQFTEYQYSTLTACVRGANDFPKRMYLTCNPGGIGHEWVKRLFVARKYRQAENPEDYRFIPATVFDNTVMLEKDKGYVEMLNNLPAGLREAWRDGSWDLLEGRYFSEFDRSIHIVKPFEIPQNWRKYRGMDYGLDCLACVWVAIDEKGNYYVYREYARSDKVISVGAREINEFTPSGEYVEYTASPPDMWGRTQESGKTKADLFSESGLILLKSSNNREAGWLAIKDLLSTNRLFIFDNCIELIDCITSLQRDKRHPTDCATEPHNITHLPDALRYFVLQFTSPSEPPKGNISPMERYRKQALSGKKKRGRSYF